MTINGTFTLHQEDLVDRDETSCQGTGGYDDIRDGLEVAVTDAAGTVIGLGRLSSKPGEDTFAGRRTCEYEFTVSGLPDASFYGVEVGHRGVVRFSAADLAQKGWAVEVELGP